MNMRILSIQIQRRLRACLNLAQAHFHRTFPMPSVLYNVRGLKAGVAYLQQNEIRLNRTLLEQNPEEFIRETVPHELAHLIVYQHYGRRAKPHGQEWRFVMEEVFKLPANVCHEYDTTSVRGKTVEYQCDCQIHQLGIRKHHRIQSQSAVYRCRKCKSVLREM
ncbi:SprT family zinc-dependent metalloprotease [Pasteurellaceae bacterium HPA106]|uniref:SprT family zinc-dependent metalloprotease n=1 Tax=Spirabiliibacterium pneumoniae TaxID=221400 RepID=UPI001AACEFAA|nr:SprT family zinc-dependent metalloprotease [Spirabiliibacterium pneumoniae]MBE2895807.1 SprT family zinc-dependent metalloprotease [Spirabiliibacterium pneumoniae]